ncbi:MAG: hypothetical protein FWH08_00860 [Oscillospiraceae bacterium]|nr:hypothetical protein [Oscillospiraceae bacterium]
MQKFKKLLAMVIAGVMTVALATTASANSQATGIKGDINGYAGYNYYAWNAIQGLKIDGKYYADGWTVIQTQNLGNVPSGYCAGLARTYNYDTGALLKERGWTYNTTGTNGVSIASSAEVKDKTTCYSSGLVRVFDGSNYTDFSTYNSPNINTYV